MFFFMKLRVYWNSSTELKSTVWLFTLTALWRSWNLLILISTACFFTVSFNCYLKMENGFYVLEEFKNTKNTISAYWFCEQLLFVPQSNLQQKYMNLEDRLTIYVYWRLILPTSWQNQSSIWYNHNEI